MKLKQVVSSKRAFYIIVGILVFQALWIAFSNRYPMAFDEDYHFGLIKFYAHHPNPFLSTQPLSADAYGAVFRDPSYLYHYVLSFPFRFIAAFTSSQTAQVIILRLINIALFVAGLFVFKRVLDTVGRSPAVSNISLLIFVLLPVVPLLAGQINYDNALIPLVGCLMLYLVRIVQSLQNRKKLPLTDVCLFLLVGILGCLVKYPFIPFFIAAIGGLLLAIWVLGRPLRRLQESLKKDWRATRPGTMWVFGGLLLIAVLLFSQRYVTNTVLYHTPIPDCSAVLNEKRCTAYGPWLRDYTLSHAPDKHPTGPGTYFYHEWLYGMWLRLFFMVDGPVTLNQTRGPLLIPAKSALVFSVLSVVAVIIAAKTLYRKYGLVLFLPLAMGVFYVLLLFFDGYEAYHRTGHPVAINGRYLLPILPIYILASGLAFNQLFRRWTVGRALLPFVVILCLLWGGGVLTFILRTNDYWYWNNPTVRHANYTVRHTLGPVTPGYSNPTLYLR